MSEWQDDQGNTLYSLPADDAGAYGDPNQVREADDSSDDEIEFSDDEDFPVVSADDGLLGFPPGKTKADFFAINGGQPPFGDWRWPDGFGETEKALFWSASSKSGGQSYEESAIYNQVSQFNTGGGYGKMGMTTVEAFQSAESMYQPYGIEEAQAEVAAEAEPAWQENPLYQEPQPEWQDNPLYQAPGEPEWQENPLYQEPQPEWQDNPLYQAPGEGEQAEREQEER